MLCCPTEITDAYRECRRQLLEAGILISMQVDGLYGLSGVFEDVVERFEQLVTRRARRLRAEVMRFPAIMSRDAYLKMTHLDNFPDLLGSVHSFTGNERDHARMLGLRNRGEDWTQALCPTQVMMTPAACYPLYPTATGSLADEGRLIDLRSFVFRHEPALDPARMMIFRQREFVRLGTAEQALAHREFWLEEGTEVLNLLGLPVERVVANDPFFGRAGRLMADAQKDQILKYELTITVASEEKPTAIASCNYHQNHFGKTFDIMTPDGNPAHTACIGYGLERIALALFMRHGFDTDRWPNSVKNTLDL
ncbi:MAG TPA: amino acid--[acyl-carrier-protein] ligase [Pirellulales bacterium]|jgi:seryl-tRNA synthetase|nr:amino acid--[acyl-carrier-protein] ligase [Pirellulales bacterium]